MAQIHSLMQLVGTALTAAPANEPVVAKEAPKPADPLPEWVSKPEEGFMVGESRCVAVQNKSPSKLDSECRFRAQDNVYTKKCAPDGGKVRAWGSLRCTKNHSVPCVTDKLEEGVKCYVHCNASKVECLNKK